MFGPRLSRIFASRWMALWWAATILLLTWQLVPSADEDDGAPSSSGASAAHAASPTNPWAIDKRSGEKND